MSNNLEDSFYISLEMLEEFFFEESSYELLGHMARRKSTTFKDAQDSSHKIVGLKCAINHDKNRVDLSYVVKEVKSV